MRLAISILASLLVIVQLDAQTAGNHPMSMRVRPMQNDAKRVLATGIAQSPTFRRLVDRLEQSNVIVYIELRPDMPAFRGGSLRFLAHSATDYFLKIHLNRQFTGKTLIALLGHELQHAVEVADAGGIGSAEDLRALYRRLGEPTGIDQFDTAAARNVGYRVREELNHVGHQPSLRLARNEDPPLPDMENLVDDEDGGRGSSTIPAVRDDGTANPDIQPLRR
jgi:hypothetical protein